MQPTEQTVTAEDLAELDYYRSGGRQLAYDPITKDSPVHESSEYGTYEPVWYVQYTYGGVPVWHCGGCNRVHIAATNPYNCSACGDTDNVGELTPDEPLSHKTAGAWGLV